jgi:hypothetical protein
MMIKRFLNLLIVALFPLVASSQQSDFGIWVNVDADVSLSKKFDLQFSGSLRSYQNTSKLEEAFLEGMSTSWKITAFIMADINFLQI